MDLTKIRQLLTDDLNQLNSLIEQRLHSHIPLINELAQHIIHSGGKRIRPMLLLLCSKAFNYSGNEHIELAAVIEFIHTATLLHDDVVDESSLRRGQATANNIWGDHAPVLVGDFLYSRSFQMMVAINRMKIMKILADATNTISEGEVLQLVNSCKLDISENDYINIIKHKTATLFAAASQCGTVIADVASASEIDQAMHDFGMHLGIAYQIMDDILDYQANAEQFGKNIGDDFAEGKVTLPIIQALISGTKQQQQQIKLAFRQRQMGRESQGQAQGQEWEQEQRQNLDQEQGQRQGQKKQNQRQKEQIGNMHEMIANIREIIHDTNALGYSIQVAKKHAHKALALLDDHIAKSSPFKESLRSIVEFVVARRY